MMRVVYDFYLNVDLGDCLFGVFDIDKSFE